MDRSEWYPASVSRNRLAILIQTDSCRYRATSPFNGRERTVFCSIGGEQAEPQDPADLRWQRRERPVQHELSARGASPKSDRGKTRRERPHGRPWSPGGME